MFKLDGRFTRTKRLSDRERELVTLIADDAWMMRALECVARQGLADWWIVAGFVRAKVWDSQHGYAQRTPIGDVDVVFFDTSMPPAADREIEARLHAAASHYPWEVYNQAHMHAFNGDSPYRDTVDSFSRWAETVSTVGIRLEDERLIIAAPHGLEDLFDMVIRPTPHIDANREVFEQRLGTKQWRRLWPRARVERNPG